MTARPSRPAAGFTLVEVLIALVLVSILMGSVATLFRSQNQAFIRGGRRMDALENQRYAISTLTRALRTLGAGVSGNQPMLVYGAADVVAFNSDYVENDTSASRWAVYFDPDADSVSTLAWDFAARTAIPHSAYVYPPETYRYPNGAPSAAETMIFYLDPDSSTARADDYALFERVNAAAPALVARNLLAQPGRPFFEYLIRRTPPGLRTAAAGELPLIRRSLVGLLTAADTAAALRPDSVVAVRINLRVTNGLTGADERTQDVSTVVETPNNGLPQPTVCGRRPTTPSGLTATPDSAGTGRVALQWGASPDQDGGEQDVRQYVIYQRPTAATTWADPLMNVRADQGTPIYGVTVGGLTPGASYTFGVAAQDCTPAFSTLIQTTVTAP